MANNIRQQLYDRIRESSKEEVILEEMQRLGFWPKGEGKPAAAEELIKRRGELQRELNELARKQHLYADPELAVKEMRKKRMAQAKQRRIETRQRKNEERYEKAKAWHERRHNEILYLGDGVSNRLDQIGCDTQRLQKHALPVFASSKVLAEQMGITIGELRFLCFTRNTARLSHYRRFVIAKKTGGERLISAPMPRLKRAQYWLLDNILQKIPLHDAAHGFRKGRSIVSNAEPHVGSYIVFNCDVKDFFPTFEYRRVKGLFAALGYSDHFATIFALLCTEPDIQEAELDGETFYLANGERHLPQGAPTSPVLTNIICRRLDRRLAGMAKSLGFHYTRYADDMTFSGDKAAAKKLGKLQWRLNRVLEEEGLLKHPHKDRVMRAGQRQEVTGIVVNDQLSLDRKTLQRFRALIHQVQQHGPAGRHWAGNTNVLSAMRGFANYVAMVKPEKGQHFQQQVAALSQKYAGQTTHSKPGSLNKTAFRAAAADGKAPREPWWQPAESLAPVKEVVPEKTTDKTTRGRARQTQRDTSDIIRDALDTSNQTRIPLRIRGRIWWWRIRLVLFAFIALYIFKSLLGLNPILSFVLAMTLVAFLFGLARF